MLILDRRRCRTPATGEFRMLLNSSQRVSLDRLEREGWRLRFVRQAAAGMPEPVLSLRDHTHAVMRLDGQLDMRSPVVIRA